MPHDESNGRFIQFPLCVLSMQQEFRQIMDYSISHGICHFMDSLESDEYENDDEKFVHAQRTVGFKDGSLASSREQAAIVRNHWSSFETRCHRTALVRIPTDYAFEIRNGDWSENEGRVYIGIASAIGQKNYVRLGWERIAWRASGHLKHPVCRLMTRAKVDYAASQLVGRGLLACYTLNRGVRYWSFPGKCSREQTARFVLAARMKKQHIFAESDNALTARITTELLKEAK